MTPRSPDRSSRRWLGRRIRLDNASRGDDARGKETQAMTDEERYSTAECLQFGILNRPMLESKCPFQEQELFKFSEDEFDSEAIQSAIQDKGIYAPMYYGLFRVWKSGDGTCSGELMQYRVVTDSFTDISVEVAMEKASDWYGRCYG